MRNFFIFLAAIYVFSLLTAYTVPYQIKHRPRYIELVPVQTDTITQGVTADDSITFVIPHVSEVKSLIVQYKVDTCGFGADTIQQYYSDGRFPAVQIRIADYDSNLQHSPLGDTSGTIYIIRNDSTKNHNIWTNLRITPTGQKELWGKFTFGMSDTSAAREDSTKARIKWRVTGQWDY